MQKCRFQCKIKKSINEIEKENPKHLLNCRQDFFSLLLLDFGCYESKKCVSDTFYSARRVHSTSYNAVLIDYVVAGAQWILINWLKYWQMKLKNFTLIAGIISSWKMLSFNLQKQFCSRASLHPLQQQCIISCVWSVVDFYGSYFWFDCFNHHRLIGCVFLMYTSMHVLQMKHVKVSLSRSFSLSWHVNIRSIFHSLELSKW